VGQIPTEFGKLTTLRTLDMEFNGLGLSGTIPTELCKLHNLVKFGVRGNNLSGRIPECIHQWYGLQVLFVAGNQLTGPLPSGDSGDLFCRLSELKVATMHRNRLTGQLPSCLGDMKHLESFIASNNLFEGPIPSSLSSLSVLRELLLDDNLLTGDPTQIIDTLRGLTLLFVDQNQFSGAVDEGFGMMLKDLVAMDLSSNNFTSLQFPVQLLQLPSLRILDLSVNALQGGFPDAVMYQNHDLNFLSVYYNQLVGTIPVGIIQNMTQIEHLDLSSNLFTGILPGELFQIKTLRNILLSDNPTLEVGPIPNTIIEAAPTLKELSLKNTQRTGLLPSLLGFTELYLLNLDNNGLTGDVPSTYGQLTKLQYLLLSRNPNLVGTLPDLSQLKELRTLLLDGTNITGDFSSLCQLPNFASNVAMANRVQAEMVIIATCGSPDTGIVCDCCHCCPQFENRGVRKSCSDPVAKSLDWMWEVGYQSEAWQFGVNMSMVKDPVGI